jgi:hypothetical protein
LLVGWSPYYFWSLCMSWFMAFESRRISLVECSRSSFPLFVSLLCAGLSLSLSSRDVVGGHQWEVQALSAGVRVGARHWCRVMKKVFTSSVRWVLLWRQVKRFHKMLRFCKNVCFRHVQAPPLFVLEPSPASDLGWLDSARVHSGIFPFSLFSIQFISKCWTSKFWMKFIWMLKFDQIPSFSPCKYISAEWNYKID